MNEPLTKETLSNQFTCACCEGTFDKEWTDEEAEDELYEEFPGFSTNECAIVCDDCYKKMMGSDT